MSQIDKENQINEIDTCKNGTISELMVCADLLSKGYEVFRSVSPTASFDLVAHKRNKNGTHKLIRIEVTTGRDTTTFIGKKGVGFGKGRHTDKYDVVAVMGKSSGTIFYFDVLGTKEQFWKEKEKRILKNPKRYLDKNGNLEGVYGT